MRSWTIFQLATWLNICVLNIHTKILVKLRKNINDVQTSENIGQMGYKRNGTKTERM